MNRTIRRLSIGSALALAAILATSRDAHPQSGFDYGDAPEDALAYPSTGGTGLFPTCLGGSASFVRHGLGWAHFFSAGPQPGWDMEGDGNAGVCVFPTYDNDECFADGDAGLLTPTAFTVVGGAVVPCPNAGSPVALGPSCQMATIQANVVNNMPPGVTGYINVLFDWDRNGAWGGAWSCGSSSAPEHAVVDDPIPQGFSGVWTSPPFRIGSPGGVHVWMRLEIAERAVGPNWDGSGSFEDGESEDYLVEVLLPSIPIQQESWGRIKALYR
jgi:hypothetical protein